MDKGGRWIRVEHDTSPCNLDSHSCILTSSLSSSTRVWCSGEKALGGVGGPSQRELHGTCSSAARQRRPCTETSCRHSGCRSGVRVGWVTPRAWCCCCSHCCSFTKSVQARCGMCERAGWRRGTEGHTQLRGSSMRVHHTSCSGPPLVRVGVPSCPWTIRPMRGSKVR